MCWYAEDKKLHGVGSVFKFQRLGAGVRTRPRGRRVKRRLQAFPEGQYNKTTTKVVLSYRKQDNSRQRPPPGVYPVRYPAGTPSTFCWALHIREGRRNINHRRDISHCASRFLASRRQERLDPVLRTINLREGGRMGTTNRYGAFRGKSDHYTAGRD